MSPDPVDAWLDAVVLLRLGAEACSGAQIAPDRVLTAWHCVAAGGRPSVEWRDGSRGIGRIAGADRSRDLALVVIPANPGPVLSVAAAPPGPGTPIHALGHPHGADRPEGFYEGTLRWSAVDGEVAAVGARALQLTADLFPGSSGGPVVDGEGRVVGVVSRRLGGVAFAGRADGVTPGATWGRGPGAVASAHLLGFDASAGDGLPAAGGRLQVTLADRVWVAGGAYAPWAPRLAAERRGSSAAVVAEGLGGLRQRLGRGPWSADLDAFAGVAAVERWAPDGDGDVRGVASSTWTVGARLSARGLGFEWAILPDVELARASIVIHWPGTLAVF